MLRDIAAEFFILETRRERVHLTIPHCCFLQRRMGFCSVFLWHHLQPSPPSPAHYKIFIMYVAQSGMSCDSTCLEDMSQPHFVCWESFIALPFSPPSCMHNRVGCILCPVVAFSFYQRGCFLCANTGVCRILQPCSDDCDDFSFHPFRTPPCLVPWHQRTAQLFCCSSVHLQMPILWRVLFCTGKLQGMGLWIQSLLPLVLCTQWHVHEVFVDEPLLKSPKKKTRNNQREGAFLLSWGIIPKVPSFLTKSRRCLTCAIVTVLTKCTWQIHFSR